MPITDYKITDTTGVKVRDIPGSTLPGSDPATNKQVFDEYSDLIVNKFNALVDYLSEQGVSDLAVWKANILKQAYPVGSIYVSVNTVNPSTLFGGTWQQIKDKFLLCAGDTYSNGSSGGSADAVVPTHTHTFSATSGNGGGHTHTASGSTGDRALTGSFELWNTYSGNTTASGIVSSADASDNNYTGNSANARSHARFNLNATHNHSFYVTTTSNGAHTHSVSGTTESTGSSGVGANMPPYFAVTVWKRTA